MSSTAASIHTSRGFGGYRPSSCTPESPWSTLRFLGPSARIAGLLAALWGTACLLHTAVLIQAARTLAVATSGARDLQSEHLTTATSAAPNLAVLAAVHLTLSVLTLVVVITVLRVDCRYDPDWPTFQAATHVGGGPNAGMGVSVVGVGGDFGGGGSTTLSSERVSRVAWVI